MDVTNSTASKTTLAEAKAALQAVAADADTRSATAVSTLTLVHQARLSNQKRAATLAVAVYGAGSSQATAAQETVTATTTTAARLAALTQRANTPTPTVAATGWTLHGRAYTSDLAPQPGYAVFLVDANKNYLSDYGYSYTDDTGYFLISYAGPASGASQSGKAQSTGSTTAAPEFYIQITDAKANPVLLTQTAFVPVSGKATYQSITLPAGDKPLGDLPADIRAVALPDLTPAPKQKAPKSAAQKTDTTPRSPKS
jgi:hypothetical protein